jgi:SAM-dependent methyltransferase
VTATFLVTDALALKDLPDVFDNVIDSGLFYVFNDDHRRRYVEGLAIVLKPGGRLLLLCLDQFAYLAVWSAGIGQNAEEFEKRNETFFKDADKVNKAVKLFSISVGDKDFALTGSKALDELLKKHDIKHELHISGGGHTWINWRHYLNDLAPQLFR